MSKVKSEGVVVFGASSCPSLFRNRVCVSGNEELILRDRTVSGAPEPMGVSPERRALQREAQLAAQQLASGVTIIGRANHAQIGLYSQAFFELAIGLERLGKLIVVADHAVNSNGSFPTNDYLKQISHDLRKLLPKCELIGETTDASRRWASRPADPIHKGIEETLSEFSIRLRYYNLDYITRAAGQQLDPIAMWWKKVAEPICELHYSERKRMNDAAKAGVIAETLAKYSIIRQYREDGTELADFDFFSRPSATAVVQKYGRLYTLQIVRWLAAILRDLCDRGAYKERIEPLLGLGEPFRKFNNDDKCFRDVKTWSIY